MRSLTPRVLRLLPILVTAIASAAPPENKAADTDLLTAVRRGDPTAARLELERGANVNARGPDGSTPLMIAAEHGSADMVRLLLDKGADVSPKRNDGSNAVMLAAKRGLVEVVRALRIAANSRTPPANEWFADLDLEFVCKPMKHCTAAIRNGSTLAAYTDIRVGIAYSDIDGTPVATSFIPVTSDAEGSPDKPLVLEPSMAETLTIGLVFGEPQKANVRAAIMGATLAR